MTCWQCAAAIPGDARFCPYCGAKQPSACPACGAPALPDARFCKDCGTPLGGAAPPTRAGFGSPVELASRALDAERRHLTILFSDLVDSTILSERLDPEDLSQVMTAYETVCRREVARFDGAVVRIVGDGILCCFGYPRAHEDDAERAISAGLDMIEGVTKLEAAGGARLRVRIGIATGLVVVTELMDTTTGRTSEMVGSTPILAVRLQAAVSPNSLIIADSTRRLIGNAFTLEDLGLLQLKGITDPVQAWRVCGRGGFSSRFEAVFAEGDVSPLVGRTDELSLLIRRAEEAAAGAGQAVLLSGEAGIGKSRTVHALKERLSSRRFRFVYCYCSPYQQNTPFYPLIALFERSYQFVEDDPPEQRIAAFHEMVESAGQGAAASALLAGLMSIGWDVETPPLSPQRERELTFEALLRQLASLMGEGPAVLVFENTHWADPSTTELLDLLVEQIRHQKITLIATLRPSGTLLWHHWPHVLELTLSRLNQRDCAAIIEGVAGGFHLPANVLHGIIEKTDGIPLFVEEMTKALLESGFLSREGDRYALSGAIPPMAVPATLQESLMSRLDRLAPAREVAQIGAVIGREFSYDLLSAVSVLTPATLDSALAQLVDAGVLFQQGMPPNARYIFKHALLQDAASASLLRRKRQRLHEGIAAALEVRRGERSEATLGLLAHHCTEAGLTEKAVRYWLAAGNRAGQRSASIEAVAHYHRARTLVATLEDSPAAWTQELELLTALGPALITTGGPGTAEVQEVYGRALEVCASLPESPLHFVARWGWWRISMDLRAGRQRATELLQLAKRLGDRGLLLQGHHCQWATLFNLGDHPTCCAHIEAGLALYDPEQHRNHAALYGGHDPRVCGLGERALALWLLGQPDRGLASAKEGLAWARALAHVGSLAHSLDQHLMLLRYRRDVEAVQHEALGLIEFAHEQSLPDHRLKGEVFLGWTHALRGDPGRGLEQTQEALDEQRRIGTTEDFPVYYDMLAEILAMLGRFAEAQTAIACAFDTAASSGLAYWTPELHRRRAELLAAQAGTWTDEVGASLHAARELARAQGARGLELRIETTALDLACDDDVEAMAANLQQTYGCFTEGFDTADLAAARRSLASRHSIPT